MDYQLEVTPTTREEGVKAGKKYWEILIADVGAHTTAMSPTSLAKKLEQPNKTEPHRAYGPMDLLAIVNPRAYAIKRFMQDPEFVEFVRGKEAEGYKVAFSFLKSGTPLELGKDTKEFMASTNGKRLFRAIAKGKSKD
jgi:hypothetical protein